MFRHLTRLSLFVAGLGLAPSAMAISCDEIVNMTRVNVPANIVVTTIQNSGTRFAPADIQCLVQNNVDPSIVQAASAQAAGPAAPPPGQQPPIGQPPVGQPPVGQPMMPGLGDETFGSDIPMQGNVGAPPSTGNDPAVLEQLIAAQRNDKHLTASKGLHDLLATNQYPEFETKIQFYLAKSLFDLEMYHGAQHYFMQVVRRGPRNPYFKYALPRLVAIASITGNDAELLRIAHKIPVNDFPARAKDRLHYLVGRRQFERGNLAESLSEFKQVNINAGELYLRSKYFEGVILNEQEKYATSVAAFKEVVQAKVRLADTSSRKLREIEDLKDLAMMNIARTYFGLQRFESAENFYTRVDRESGYWADSVFERAWANFHLLDLNETLGLVLTARSPYFSETEFNPELRVLRALTYWRLCDFDEVERQMVDFEARAKPMAAELEAFLNQYKTRQGQELADKAFDAYFVDGTARSVLPPAMFSRVLRNRDLSALVNHMDMMDEEIESIDQQKAIWKDSVGDQLKKIIEKDRARYKKRAGLTMLVEMRKQHAALRDLLGQSEIIRFEVVSAQAEDYEFKVANEDLDQVDERTINFATNPEIVYWPFNGEFWKDELGYYRYTEEPQCN